MIAITIGLGVLAIFASVLGYLSGRRTPCPTCGHPGLRTVNWIRATILVDGRRAPDSWTYHWCEACGGRFKRRGGSWVVPSSEEWDHYASSTPGAPTSPGPR